MHELFIYKDQRLIVFISRCNVVNLRRCSSFFVVGFLATRSFFVGFFPIPPRSHVSDWVNRQESAEPEKLFNRF